MSEFERIPAEAFKGLRKPQPEMWKQCWTCGGSNVRTMSMAEMMMVHPARIVNAHTFIQPGVAWGYMQCDDCENKQEATVCAKAPKRSWLRRFLGKGTEGEPNAN